jgi:hypothetical protein
MVRRPPVITRRGRRTLSRRHDRIALSASASPDGEPDRTDDFRRRRRGQWCEPATAATTTSTSSPLSPQTRSTYTPSIRIAVRTRHHRSRRGPADRSTRPRFEADDWPPVLCSRCHETMEDVGCRRFLDFRFGQHPACPQCGGKRTLHTAHIVPQSRTRTFELHAVEPHHMHAHLRPHPSRNFSPVA